MNKPKLKKFQLFLLIHLFIPKNPKNLLHLLHVPFIPPPLRLPPIVTSGEVTIHILGQKNINTMIFLPHLESLKRSQEHDRTHIWDEQRPNGPDVASATKNREAEERLPGGVTSLNRLLWLCRL